MNLRALVLGIGAIVAGALLLPGASTGPRLGMGVFLITLGLLALTMAALPWFLRKTTRPEDYEGTCPVGESCPDCGAWNFKPRLICRSCGHPVNRDEA